MDKTYFTLRCQCGLAIENGSVEGGSSIQGSAHGRFEIGKLAISYHAPDEWSYRNIAGLDTIVHKGCPNYSVSDNIPNAVISMKRMTCTHNMEGEHYFCTICGYVGLDPKH